MIMYKKNALLHSTYLIFFSIVTEPYFSIDLIHIYFTLARLCKGSMFIITYYFLHPGPPLKEELTQVSGGSNLGCPPPIPFVPNNSTQAETKSNFVAKCLYKQVGEKLN